MTSFDIGCICVLIIRYQRREFLALVIRASYSLKISLNALLKWRTGFHSRLNYVVHVDGKYLHGY